MNGPIRALITLLAEQVVRGVVIEWRKVGAKDWHIIVLEDRLSDPEAVAKELSRKHGYPCEVRR